MRTWSGGAGPLAPAPSQAVPEVSDAYLAARRAATDWLTRHYSGLLADPAGQERAVAEAIAQALAETGAPADLARRLRTDLWAAVLGAGPLQAYLEDPLVTEIAVTGTMVWVERAGRWHREPDLPSPEAAFRVAEDLAAKVGRRFQQAHPRVDLTWPDGSRVNLVHPALCPKGAVITIRKRNQGLALELADLVRLGVLTAEMAGLLVAAVRGRLNVLLSGSTGAGKTTNLRALANAALTDPAERVITLEDTEELRLVHPHTVPLVSTQGQGNELTITLHDLFVNALRMRPDRLLVGEVRSVEALDMLEAGMSEHGGMLTTMHLEAPERFGPRLFWLAQRAGWDVSLESITREAYQVFGLVAHVDKFADGTRRVTRISEPDGTGMRDLWRWDPEAGRHVAVGELSPARVRKILDNGGGWPPAPWEVAP
ncbi:Type II/IV secretion system ATP hydrolase TadA/VirB11/CpaF, TadA subfamily [Candidatus Hydrogenisulfobacillus filiaventi]|uniref:Type II/IV secretion system ATP hydrolase TadA/VirB11/CpaF, TadA subfamily n=1 Tax=Candidatus Hydrogenisulfobacillus filiaventi TaxID=2707344 RepID=A0A6F8ZJ37_9FIRM|nr:Type II/IV secretion system ATP hydrolase TadA/VirB11/CpaF, TadA subfamily [Candidatus Hydrogenisulfobacillus filiaventi]